MKRIGLYVIVLMYMFTMCSNDIVTVERALVDRGSDDYVGNNQVWDFSSVPVLDSNVQSRYMEVSDSAIIEFCGQTMQKYTINSDAVYWTGYENRSTKMQSQHGVLLVKLPLSLGDSCESSYHLNGKYYQQMYMSETGSLVSKADATGILILPQGDTIENVIRLKTIYRFQTKHYSAEKDTLTATIPWQIVTHNRWFAPDYKYPIAEERAVEIVTKVGSHHISHLSQVMLSPSSQIKTKTDTPTEFRKMQEDVNLIKEVIVIFSDGTIVVEFTTERQTKVDIYLTDLSGSLLTSKGGTYDTGKNELTINARDLLPGNYMVVLIPENDTNRQVKQMIRVK